MARLGRKKNLIQLSPLLGKKKIWKKSSKFHHTKTTQHNHMVFASAFVLQELLSTKRKKMFYVMHQDPNNVNV